MKITPEYIAGFFDGEGCVATSVGRNGVGKIQVILTSTDEHILKLVKSKYGGGIYKKIKYKEHHSDAFSWQSSKCRSFLEDIFPFLILKRKQVRLALEFLDTIDNSTGPRRLSEPIKNKRIKIIKIIQKLNH